jgi:hypothetical protein
MMTPVMERRGRNVLLFRFRFRSSRDRIQCRKRRPSVSREEAMRTERTRVENRAKERESEEEVRFAFDRQGIT